MNKVNLADEDLATLHLQDLADLSIDQVKSEFINERQRCLVMERDLFKAQSENRRLDQQIKTLQEINTLNAKNRNNTSSAFTLPSEFKQAWDELVKEHILDAYPDFLDRYEELVPLVQELFIALREEIIEFKKRILIDIGLRLNLIDLKSDQQTQDQIINYLDQKFQPIFQEYSLKIFQLSDAEINTFIETKYKPRCLGIIEERDGALDDLDDNLSSNDFKRFIRAVLKLSLHMILNDPPILLAMDTFVDKQKKEQLVEKFEFWMFNKNDYYCIDGFPKEGYPCVVVLPPPFRAGYVYQGIKPAVIVLNDPNDDLMDHVRIKQEDILEKIKAKRQFSLCSRDDDVRQQETYKPQKEEEITQQPINIVNLSHRSIKESNKENNSSNNSNIHHSKRKQDDDSLELTIEKIKLEIQNEIMEQYSHKKSSNHNQSSSKKYSEQEQKRRSQSRSKSITSRNDLHSSSKSSAKLNQTQRSSNISPLKSKTYSELSALKSARKSGNKKSSNKKNGKEENNETNSTQNLGGTQPLMSETFRQLQLKSDILNKESDYYQNGDNSCKSMPENISSRGQRKQESQREDEEDIYNNHLAKSPIELKEKLSSIYSEYVNVKQRQLSSSQYFNKQTLEKKTDIMQSEQVSSARRRSSNNYNVSNTQIQSNRVNKYEAEKSSRNSTINGNLTGSQSQVFQSSSSINNKMQDAQTFKSSIQNQIRKLAETMRGQINSNVYKSNGGGQQEYQTKASISQQQQQPQAVSNNHLKQTPQQQSIRDSQKCYEMPKKAQSDSQKRLALQSKNATPSQPQSSINNASANTSSIIAEMHYQNGMSSIKQDLQRKIHNYQSILKKTYADKVQKNQNLINSQSKAQYPKSPFEHNKFTTLDQATNQSKISTEETPSSQSHIQDKSNNTNQSMSKGGVIQNKIENLQSLKSAFFKKIHTLNQKLEHEKTSAQQQRLSSRSKSPLQKNMPRQYPFEQKPNILVKSKPTVAQSKKSIAEDTSSSDSEDLNRRTEDMFVKKTYAKDGVNINAQEYKRARKQDVNFKSLSKINTQDIDTRGSKQNGPEVTSPKPCVTYRGTVGINGTSHGLISNSQVYSSNLYQQHKYRQ